MPVLSTSTALSVNSAEGPPIRGLRREPVLSLPKGSAERRGSPLCFRIWTA